MISWIQNTFQKHFRVIFLALLAVLIVSFVFTIGAAPGIGQGGQEIRSREFFDANLSSPEDQKRIFGDASLSVFLQAGYPALQEQQLQQYALQRYAGLHLADEMGLPQPTNDEVATFIRELGAFSGPSGTFDPAAYARFRDNLTLNPELTEADVSRVIADDYRYRALTELLGGPGYVLDTDVEQQLARADSTWTLNIATIDFASFSPSIEPTDAALQTYFDNNSFRYEIPPRVRVRYAAFQATSYVNQINVTPAEVRAYYDANPSRFPKPADANADANAAAPTVGTDTDAAFAAVRPQVEAALRMDRAARLAAKAASDFTVALFDASVPADRVTSYFADRNIDLKTVAPFARNNVPAIFGGYAQVGTEAFKLGPDRPFSDALGVPGGAVILVWEESLPAQTPSLAEVKDQVAADYVANEKRQRFLAAGRTLRTAVKTALDNGTPFADAVASAANTAGVTATTKTAGPFTRREPPEDVSDTVLSSLDRLQQGDVSEMILSQPNGFVVHVAKQVKPELAPDSARFVEVREQMARFNAAQNADAYLRNLVETELTKSEPTVAN